jgi:hypothetical protein
MKFVTKDNRTVYLRNLNSNDLDNLVHYLEVLSVESKKRFGPHQFDRQSIIDFYKDPYLHKGYVAQTIDTNEIVAYAIIKFSLLQEDFNRYHSYGIKLNNITDCEFAPSVADTWQSCGIGNSMFKFILTELKKTKVKRIILWGGVQADNQKAVSYYKKNAFQLVGKFSHNGENFDMILEI